MSFEVVADELTSAAGALDGAADAYGCYELPVTDATPESYGHVELAGWVQGVGAAFDTALEQLQAAHATMGQDLRASAAAYRTSDESALQRFDLPWIRPAMISPAITEPGAAPGTTGRLASRLAQ